MTNTPKFPVNQEALATHNALRNEAAAARALQSQAKRFRAAAALHEQKAGYWANKESGYGDTQAKREILIADSCEAQAEELNGEANAAFDALRAKL